MKYAVEFSEFAESHYIKSFKKKYKSAWDKTQTALYLQYSNFDFLFQKNVAETIVDNKDIKICKTEFSVAGTQKSPHASGNRCIVALHKKDAIVKVLLVYSKTDVTTSGNETSWWKVIIKDNFEEYKNIL